MASRIALREEIAKAKFPKRAGFFDLDNNERLEVENIMLELGRFLEGTRDPIEETEEAEEPVASTSGTGLTIGEPPIEPPVDSDILTSAEGGPRRGDEVGLSQEELDRRKQEAINAQLETTNQQQGETIGSLTQLTEQQKLRIEQLMLEIDEDEDGKGVVVNLANNIGRGNRIAQPQNIGKGNSLEVNQPPMEDIVQGQGPFEEQPKPLTISEMLEEARTKFSKGKLSGDLNLIQDIGDKKSLMQLILGKAGSGKTNMLKVQLQLIRHLFSRIILISQTAQFTKDFEEFTNPIEGPRLEIISSLEDMDDLNIITKTKQGRDLLDTNWLIIFDDIIGFVNLNLRSKAMKRLVTTNRQSNLSLIMLSQSMKELPTVFRKNLKQLVVFDVTQIELKNLYDEFGVGLSDIKRTPFFRFIKKIHRSMGFAVYYDLERGEWYIIKVPLYEQDEPQPIQVLTEIFAGNDDGSRSEIEDKFMPVGKGRRLKFTAFVGRMKMNHPLLDEAQLMKKATDNFMKGAVMIL